MSVAASSTAYASKSSASTGIPVPRVAYLHAWMDDVRPAENRISAAGCLGEWLEPCSNPATSPNTVKAAKQGRWRPPVEERRDDARTGAVERLTIPEHELRTAFAARTNEPKRATTAHYVA